MRRAATTLLRRPPPRAVRACTAPPRRVGQRPPANQPVLGLLEDGGAAPVADLWARVEAAQAAWPEASRLETKSALKRELNYLRRLKLVRTLPGEPYRYTIVWNKYERRLPDAALPPDRG